MAARLEKHKTPFRYPSPVNLPCGVTDVNKLKKTNIFETIPSKVLDAPGQSKLVRLNPENSPTSSVLTGAATFLGPWPQSGGYVRE